MARQEPDRGSRRRWFRLPMPSHRTGPTIPVTARPNESEAPVSSEESPAEQVPVARSRGSTDSAPRPRPTRSRRPSRRRRRSPGDRGRRGDRRLDDAPPGDLDRQPEGRRRQDHDRGEPRRGAGRDGLPGPRGRPRPSGQRDDRARDQPPQRRGFDLRRDHERHAARRLRRADERQEPLRLPGDDRSRRRRDRAGAGLLPRAQAQARAPGRARRLRLHPDRLPARRSAC